jgi:hypothetical protein
MILSWQEPYQTESGIWELHIKVRGQYEIYDQVVTFETLKSAQNYIGYLVEAKKQREKGK